MGLFDWFGKKNKQEEIFEDEATTETPELDHYSGIRVEVATFEGEILFVAKLMRIHGNTAELHQYSEAAISPENATPDLVEVEPLRVKIRGYSDHERKAIYMEGTITPKDHHICHVEDLTFVGINNDRAFFRLSTNIEANITVFGGIAPGEKKCKLLNISVGGACISTEYQFHEADRFLLKVNLLEDRPLSVMYCQVLRIIEKNENIFEYGCKFLELTEEDQETITQNIFEAQRKQRSTV